MVRTKLDLNLLPFISQFERITHAKVKYCLEDMNKNFVFVIEPEQMGMALGRKASNIPRVERVLRRNIKIVAFSDDVLEFTRNLLFPLKGFDVQRNGDDIEVTADDKKVKGLIIGRERQNMKNFESIIKNFFAINNFVVK